MARKAKGKEVKGTRSVRIEPKKLEVIAKRFGTFQKWIDLKVEQEINSTKSAKTETRGALKQLTPKEKAKMKKVIDEMF